jgi:hypothetical protein
MHLYYRHVNNISSLPYKEYAQVALTWYHGFSVPYCQQGCVLLHEYIDMISVKKNKNNEKK